MTSHSHLNTVFCAVEELTGDRVLYKWFGGSADGLEVKSMIAESRMPEIYRRRGTPHQISIVWAHITTKNTTHAFILHEATWQEQLPWMQWSREHIYSRSIRPYVRTLTLILLKMFTQASFLTCLLFLLMSPPTPLKPFCLIARSNEWRGFQLTWLRLTAVVNLRFKSTCMGEYIESWEPLWSD